MKRGTIKKLITCIAATVMALTAFGVPVTCHAEDETSDNLNLLMNPGFEEDIWAGGHPWNMGTENWTGTTFRNKPDDVGEEAVKEGISSLNFWSESGGTLWVTQDVYLEEGQYTLSGQIMGEKASPVLYAKAADAASRSEKSITLQGWGNWVKDSIYIEVEKAATYTVGFQLDCEADGWGYIDGMKLYSGEPGEGATDPEEKPEWTGAIDDRKVVIKPVDGLRDDFIMGADISSIISMEAAGTKFYNSDGEEQDIFRILSDAGINSIRVRIWNDPKDKDGNSYGGGNNDLETAKAIALRAKAYGMSLLVDFHYSDFWASPDTQYAPAAWKDYNTEEKAQAISEFTTQALRQLSETGADIEMVQVGNEVEAFCGIYNDREAVRRLLRSGCDAVRNFDENIKIMIHMGGSSTGAYVEDAEYMAAGGVDFDVLGISWYSIYLHGDLNTLSYNMNRAAKQLGKQIVIAETAYPISMDDFDGFSNIFSEERYVKYKSSNQWRISPQGQAECMRDLIEKVNGVKNGLGAGIYYWEPAWITTGDTSRLTGDKWQIQYDKNAETLKKYGCGWATEYGRDYSRKVAAGVAEGSVGGNSWDNMVMFNTDGRALDSLNVFRYVYEGSETDDMGSYIVSCNAPSGITVKTGMTEDEIWHEMWVNSVECTMNDGSVQWIPVKRYAWMDTDPIINAVKDGKLGKKKLRIILNDYNNTVVDTYVTVSSDNCVLKYSKNGGISVRNMPAAQTGLTYDTDVKVLGTPDSTAAFFRGWNTRADGKGKTYIKGDKIRISGDRTLYARWSRYYVTSKGLKYKVTGRKQASLVKAPHDVRYANVPEKITVRGITYKVTGISDYAFSKCRSLKKLTVGKNVRSIGKYILNRSGSKCKVVINSKTLTSVKTVLRKDRSKMTISVPASKYGKYRKLLKIGKLKGNIRYIRN